MEDIRVFRNSKGLSEKRNVTTGALSRQGTSMKGPPETRSPAGPFAPSYAMRRYAAAPAGTLADTAQAAHSACTSASAKVWSHFFAASNTWLASPSSVPS